MRLAIRETAAPALALFASASTLICCALPALLVTIGAGAVMAGLASNVPGLVFLSQHKAWVFSFAALLLGGAWYARWATRNAPCPADPAKARACARMRTFGGITLWVASILLAVGAFFAFFAADLLL
ncbi:hypothetical protein NHF40_01090 [Maricaulaceae bacterium EIL42A08]|nr:hypothetical protein [Maricaulaceae bacterium EIL42A08]MCP2679136.1 hypothetical protein [Maricaulaceae bacterium NA33B04]